MAALGRLSAHDSSSLAAATCQSSGCALLPHLQHGAATLHTSTAAAASAPGPAGGPVRGEPANEEEKQRKILVNRLLYRARQRGFLELDLLVGLWAERNIPRMGPHALAAFSEVLDVENPDLFSWLTGQQPAPEELRANAPFLELLAHVQEQIAEHRAPGATTPAGVTWVRGWDDWKKGTFPQPVDAQPAADAKPAE